jgi:hypothetical protein
VLSQDYGYSKGSPCVFIKFKKALDWLPAYYEMNKLNETGLGQEFVNFVKSENIGNPKFLVSFSG